LNFGPFGVGWIAYLITGFIGACLLIWAGRLVRR
ncbi:GlsB/YeaQ/YmgE family stress response membrane protein, partial [Mesorhizobium sp. M7A.F.Ca.US.006.01.2.1]